MNSEAHRELRSSLVVVETALARLVVTLAPLRSGIAPPRRTTGSIAAGRFEAARSRSWAAAGAAREIGTPVAHRAAVAAWSRATVTAATATATIATTAAAAAIATATTGTAAAVAATTTAAAIATATAAAAIGRTRTATTAAATTATKSAATATTGLPFDSLTDGDRATIEESTIHGLHRCSALVICFHLEEGEAAAAAGLAIHDHF
jgi:hypothetical protein